MGFWRKLFGGSNRMPARKAGYEAAATGRRLGNWQPGQEGVNALLFRDADLMRARDLVRRNAWTWAGSTQSS